MDDSRGALPAGLGIQSLTDSSSLLEAAELYARVFRYQPKDFSLNPNLLSALAKNGGSTVGVYADATGQAPRRLVGFAYGFAGRDREGLDFHYSQAAVVDPALQGAGVGRALKLAQREVALAWGQHTMRWTFDPLLARNAHFNFNSLGAVGAAHERDYYGRPGTDRLVVDWRLDAGAGLGAAGAARAAATRALTPHGLGTREWGLATPATEPEALGGSWIAIPSSVVAGDANDAERAALRQRLADTLDTMFRNGNVLLSCSRVSDDPSTAAYLAVPASALQEQS